MAGSQGRDEQAEVREDWREEADNTNQGVVRGFPWCVQAYSTCICGPTKPSTEEFSIYLNYVRKLGFEETPDYDFLRELFAKVLKNNGDVEDGVYDWNLLNGKTHAEVSRTCPRTQCLVREQVAEAGKRHWYV